MNKGITIVGNILTDVVKIIDTYPKKGMLSNISKQSKAVGGCVPNTIINIAKMDETIPLKAIGMVGNDENGEFIKAQLTKYGVDIEGIKNCDIPTSFSDVMTVESTGERTFFHMRGANAIFGYNDIDFDALNCDIFHIGYILLLDKMDEKDQAYGTVMAKVLAKVQSKGIKTSIDVVSDSNGLFKQKVIPSLKYCNYAIMNEIEACGVSGLESRNADGKLNIENITTTMKILFDSGVKDKVIVHCPEAGFAMGQDKNITIIPSLDLPKGYIVGSVGAGDTFCAGCLYGLYNDWDDEKILSFASAAAACNLSASDSISGMRKADEVFELIKKYPRKKI